MKRILLLSLIALAVCCGCAPKTYPYKVVFQDGSIEYYELNYKPKPNAGAIEYDGEVYIGIKSIEPVD